MGYLSQLFEQRAAPESVVPRDAWRPNGLLMNAAGVSVTQESSLRVAAVYACVRLLAESVAQVPLKIFERLPNGRGREEAVDHPLYELLGHLPNPEVTAFQLREFMMVHLCLRGNAFCEIVRDGNRIVALWPLPPDRVQMGRQNGRIVYWVTLPNGRGTALLEDREMFHVCGLSTDGMMGLSPIRAHAQAIGLSLATETYGATFFQNGARPGGVLEHPGSLSEQASARLRTNWEAAHQGLDNASRVAILEEGMSYRAVGIAPEEAQFLETRKFQVTDIARIFRVPPHKIGDLDRATFSNVEQQSIEFVVDTLLPWYVRFEQTIYRDLLTAAERRRYYAKFVIQGLLRGDTASRYQAYQTGLQYGFLSPNDVRRNEDMNPLPDGLGDEYMVPLNQVPLSVMAAAPSMAGQQERTRASDAGVNTASGVAAQPWAAQSPLWTVVRAAAPTAAAERRHAAAQAAPRVARALRPLLAEDGEAIADAARRLLVIGRSDEAGALETRALSDSFEAWLDEYLASRADAYAVAVAGSLPALRKAIVVSAAREMEAETWDAADWDAWVATWVEASAARQLARTRTRVEDALADADAAAAVEAVGDGLADSAEFRGHDDVVRFANGLALVVLAAYGATRKTVVSFEPSCPFCSRLDGNSTEIGSYFLKAGEPFAGAEGATLTVSRNIGHPPFHAGCDCMVMAG